MLTGTVLLSDTIISHALDSDLDGADPAPVDTRKLEIRQPYERSALDIES